ncbi:MAG: hypothetical protein AAF629_00330 [Chloroflexota bacterium]
MSLKRWSFFIISGICLISLSTLMISGWLERNPTVGAFIAATIFFLLLGSLAAGMFYLGAAWTERQVKLGAHIATTAQQIDNQADERKMAALAHFGRQMMQTSLKLPNQTPPYQLTPPLLEEQQPHWLPPLTMSSSQLNEEGMSNDPHH